jgi:hypothetical protein
VPRRLPCSLGLAHDLGVVAHEAGRAVLVRRPQVARACHHRRGRFAALVGVEDLPDHAHAGELALGRALAAGDLERVDAAAPERRDRAQAAGAEGHALRGGGEAAGEAVPQPAPVGRVVLLQAGGERGRERPAVAVAVDVGVAVEADRPAERAGQVQGVAAALLVDAAVVENEGLDLQVPQTPNPKPQTPNPKPLKFIFEYFTY